MQKAFNIEALKRSFCFLLLVFSSAFHGFSQSDFRTDNDYNRDANSMVLAINNNGYRIGYRYSQRIDGFNSRLFDVDFFWFQHYKEKTANFSSFAYSRYTYGKLNQLMILKLSVGKEKEQFQKFSKNGVAILFTYNLGFSLGILKPYYLLDIDNNYILFDDEDHLSAARIVKRAPFVKGFKQIKPALGGFLQVAVSFDINNKYRNIRRLELGASLDFFHRKLPILSQVSQKHYIATLYFAYRFGKKTDASIQF